MLSLSLETLLTVCSQSQRSEHFLRALCDGPRIVSAAVCTNCAQEGVLGVLWTGSLQGAVARQSVWWPGISASCHSCCISDLWLDSELCQGHGFYRTGNNPVCGWHCNPRRACARVTVCVCLCVCIRQFPL